MALHFRVRLATIIALFQSQNMFSIRSIWWGIGIAVIVGLMGLYPHVRFSMEMGSLSYFKSAFDEDTYALLAIGHEPLIFYRALSAWIFNALTDLTAGRVDYSLIILDGVFPALCAAAAWILSGALFPSIRVRVFFSLILLFSPDILSLGNSSVYGDFKWNLGYLRAVIPSGEILIPDYTTSYLSLYRTPEPQLAWTLLFFQLAIILTIAKRMDSGEGVGYSSLTLLAMINVLLAFSYVVVSLPTFGLQLALVAILALRNQYRIAIYLGMTVLVAAGLVIYYVGAYQSEGGASLIFPSRLPEFSPSTLLSLMLLVGWFGHFRRQKGIGYVATIGVVAGVLPLIILNQQVLTGYMVSTKDWERSVNYELVVFSCALLLREQLIDLNISKIVKSGAVLGTMGIFYLIMPALNTTYVAWNQVNVDSMAIAKGLSQVPEKSRSLPIVMENPSLIPLLTLRSGFANYLGTYNQLFIDRVENIESRSVTSHLEHLRQKYWLYEYLFRREVSPDELKNNLVQEVQSASGYHLAFFFSFLDHWYPASDYRLVRKDLMNEAIPMIVADYAALIENPPPSWLQPTLFVSAESPKSDSRFVFEKLAIGEVAGRTEYIYFQTAR